MTVVLTASWKRGEPVREGIVYPRQQIPPELLRSGGIRYMYLERSTEE
jgi:hypothetical protein